MIALLAQLASVEGNVRANAERAANILAEHPDADIAVFPELYLSGYVTSGLETLARSANAHELRIVADAAAKSATAVMIGFAEERPAGRPANAAACIDRDGRLAAVYRKTQLFGAEQEAFDELLAVSSANMAPFYVDHDVATRARALENRLPLVYANAVGTLGGLTFVGGSRSIAPGGEILAEAAEPDERILLGPVALDEHIDDRVDYLQHLPRELKVSTP